MEHLVGFTVPGIPVPQGSKGASNRGGKPHTFDTNSKELRPWRRKVRDECRRVWRDEGRSPVNEPVHLEAIFRFLPTFSDPDRHWKAGVPDLDKLLRALGDGMVDGGLLKDDNIIVRVVAAKLFCELSDEPGVEVTLQSLADHERLASARRLHARTRRR